ncbi:MAG TPA: selenoneine biosynthesis selenosugar synthase SenB, partial [Blastocatellia bacterium]
VFVRQEYSGESFDLLIGVHARKSSSAIRRFHAQYPERPLIVALSGTDLYQDLPRDNPGARKSLQLATRIVALQPKATEQLDPHLRDKVRVIFQSVPSRPNKNAPLDLELATKPGPTRKRAGFEICVVGHLRAVKDPFRAALAARLLPLASRIRIVHVGSAMTPAMEARALREMRVNRRYRWLGRQTQSLTSAILARSNLCVLSSRMEGGANVLSEAVVASVPILASKIPGTVGVLGEEYPGYFDVGSSAQLADLMLRAESDPVFLQELVRGVKRVADYFSPARERTAWVDLLSEL